MREEVLFDHLNPTREVSSNIPKCSEEKSRTSLHTKSSSGSVVNMFIPKENLAMLIRVLFLLKNQESASLGEADK
jgi:hypothetical protein